MGKEILFRFFYVISVLVTFLFFNQAFAQGKSNSPERRWEISFVLGAASSGPAKDIEDAMRRDGWNETLPGEWWGGPTEHSFSRYGFGVVAGLSFQANYWVRNKVLAGLFVNYTAIGYTHGYRSNPEVFLRLNYNATIISPIVLYKPVGFLLLGGGPVWFINKIEQENEEIIYREQKGRPGVVLTTSLIYPQKTRFFIKLDVQYRYVGKMTFGPFKETYRAISLAQLNSFAANFSHTFVGVGLGFRL